MALTRAVKEKIVAEVNQYAKDANSLVMAQYTGMSCSDLMDLRRLCVKQNVKVKIVKHTLAKVAFKGTQYEGIGPKLEGHSLYIFSMGDMLASTKIIKQFIADNKKLIPLHASVEGNLYEGKQIDALALLPDRDTALAQLMSTMVGPVTKLAMTMNAIPKNITIVINEISKKNKL